MKKIILISAFAMFSLYGFSQNALYGVRIGLNASNLNYEPNVPAGLDNMHRNGFAIGFFAEYKMSDNFSIAPEIQFSSEGAKDETLLIPELEDDRMYSTRLNYVQLPIFLKYKVTDKLAIGIAPQVSLKAHDYEEGIKNIAISGVGGLEYMISDEFFLDFRYTYGLTNVFDDETNLEAKNENFQFGFGVKF